MNAMIARFPIYFPEHWGDDVIVDMPAGTEFLGLTWEGGSAVMYVAVTQADTINTIKRRFVAKQAGDAVNMSRESFIGMVLHPDGGRPYHIYERI